MLERQQSFGETFLVLYLIELPPGFRTAGGICTHNREFRCSSTGICRVFWRACGQELQDGLSYGLAATRG